MGKQPAPPEDYDAFLKHRASLRDIAKHNIEAFDKALLALSSGALGLSLVFVENIGGSPESRHNYLLGAAWVGYLLAIMANLQSYRTGWRDADNEIRRQDKLFAESGRYDYSTNPAREWTKILNSLAFWLFSIATALLCAYALTNLGVEGHAKTA